MSKITAKQVLMKNEPKLRPGRKLKKEYLPIYNKILAKQLPLKLNIDGKTKFQHRVLMAIRSFVISRKNIIGEAKVTTDRLEDGSIDITIFYPGNENDNE